MELSELKEFDTDMPGRNKRGNKLRNKKPKNNGVKDGNTTNSKPTNKDSAKKEDKTSQVKNNAAKDSNKKRDGNTNKTQVKKKEIVKKDEVLEAFRLKLVNACNANDPILLENAIVESSSDFLGYGSEFQTTEAKIKVALNEKIDEDANTILHFCSQTGKHALVSVLMAYGCNPSAKNRLNQTPYGVTDNKDVRIAFRTFLKDFPQMYDYSKSHIPGPYDEQEEKEKEERRKIIKKMKREKEKEKKKVKLAEKAEEDEKQRFAQLSDREKRALAAERRIATVNTSAVLNRCFLCGTNITGKVPFTYNDYNFCTINCLKTHRIKSSIDDKS